MQKITPFLWFDDNAEEAANFYVSVFKNSRIVTASRYGEEGPGPADDVLVVEFELDGLVFLALNGGPLFKFNPSISMMVHCHTQEEIDYYWAKLVDGGQESQCGWLTDKFGLSWQITPDVLGEMLRDPDRAKAGAVMKAMLGMVKLDIAKLKAAYDQA